jgi:SET domain-containing protein
MFAAMAKPKTKKRYVVRSSGIHGRGVFATATIRKNARIIEYRGRRTTADEAAEQPDSDPNDPFHTFLFSLSDGSVIDAGGAGNAARWINHSCAPNCETVEEDDRVFIHAIRTIRPGEELTYDYQLVLDEPITRRVRKSYACGCGAPECRGTMLMEPGSTAS